MSFGAPRHRALRVAVLFCLLAVTFVVPAFAWGDDAKLRHYEVDELAKIVANEGYGSVESEENRVVFKADGRTYMLFRYDDGDLQLYYGITGISITPDDVNTWNRKRRLSRAYLDGDNDPVLEADLLANAGLNEKIVAEFIKVFVGSVGQWRSFLHDHDRAMQTSDLPASPERGI